MEVFDTIAALRQIAAGNGEAVLGLLASLRPQFFSFGVLGMVLTATSAKELSDEPAPSDSKSERQRALAGLLAWDGATRLVPAHIDKITKRLPKLRGEVHRQLSEWLVSVKPPQP